MKKAILSDKDKQKCKAWDALKKSKAFLVLTWDGKGMPAYFYDVCECQNEDDLRHFMMQSLAEEVEVASKIAREALDKKDVVKAAAGLEKVIGDEKLLTDKILTFKSEKNIILPNSGIITA